MKLQSLNLFANIKRQDNINTTNNIHRNNNSVSFKGGSGLNPAASGVVWTLDKIHNGGLAANFLIVDNLGALTRATTGLFRNSNKSGQLNKKAAAEEILREYSTGPSMFIFPGLAFLGTKKLWGKATSVDFDSLNTLKESFKGVKTAQLADNKSARDAFFTNVAKSITNDEKTVQDVSGYLSKIADTQRKDFSSKKEFKKAISSLYENISNSFARINKKDADLAITPTLVKIKAGGQTLTKDSIDYAKQAVTFAQDIVSKTVKKVDKSVAADDFLKTIDNTVRKTKGVKFLSSFAAIGILFGVMSVLPKIYSINKTYPGAEGLIDTNAAPVPQEKGAQNANK